MEKIFLDVEGERNMIRFLPLKKVCKQIVDCPHESPEWLQEGITVIRNFNLVDGQLDLSDRYCVDEETYEKRIKRAVPSDGDIIFSREAPIGNCAIIPPNTKCCLGQRLVLLRVDIDVCSSEYLLAALQSQYVKQQIEQVSKSGSIVSNFNISDLKELIIPVVSQQETVSNISATLNRKVRTNKEIIDSLEAMAKSLYDYWFVQFDFPDENGKPYRTSGGEMVWNEQLKREIPKGWKAIEYSELVDIENSSINPSSFGETVMEHYSIPAFDEDCMPAFDTADTIQSGKYRVLKESFLVSKLNPQFKRIWNPYCLTDNAICSTEFMVYKPKDITLRPICYAIANSDGFYNHMVSKAISSTGSRKRIQPDVSIKYSLAFPLDRFVVDRFCSHYSPIMEKIKKARLENYELKKLRDWLLPMLMNGQARVE